MLTPSKSLRGFVTPYPDGWSFLTCTLEGLIIGQANQVYCKWVRILPSPDNPNEMYIVIEKDLPMSIKTAKSFDERFAGKDVILTITKLVRKKRGDRGQYLV